MAIVLPAWVLVSFYIAQAIIVLALLGAKALGAEFEATNDAVFNSVVAAIVYTLAIVIVLGLPYLVRKIKVNREVLGLNGGLRWIDLALAPAGFLVYMVAAAILLALLSSLLPFIDPNQVQDTGFNFIFQRYEYVLAFVTLVIIAPIAEEVLFRGYLYGYMKRYLPVWVAVILSSLVFGFMHGSWNVGINTFVLGIVLCVLREVSGSIYPSILLHMLKNGVAFYFLFINPLFLHTLGG